MKLKKENLARASRILERLTLDLSDMSIFMPLDMEEKHIDEFGMPTTEYKAETFYGNTLIPGIINVNLDIPVKSEKSESITLDQSKTVRQPFCVLAYAQTTEIFTFNLAGYMNIIPQKYISDEDKEFILQFESCLVRTEKATLSRSFIPELYPIENKETSVDEDLAQKDEDDDFGEFDSDEFKNLPEA